jgi:carboxyl-terminal processing protease
MIKQSFCIALLSTSLTLSRAPVTHRWHPTNIIPISTLRQKIEQGHATPDVRIASQDTDDPDDESASDKKKNRTSISKEEYDKDIYNWMRVFAEVLEITGKKHYKLINPEKCMIKAIDSFLTSLDPHSGFLGPKTYTKILETTAGEFYGVGIIIDNTRKTTDKILAVVEPIAGGPAESAGVRAGDKIIDIDGKPIEGISTDEATALLKGELDTTVTIKVLREGYPDMLTFKIKRGIVTEQHSMAFYLKKHNIYYILLSQFSENSIKQVKNLLKKEQKINYKGLILDLRNNSGGLLTSAIDIASLFLDKGSLVTSTKNRSGKALEKYITTEAPIAKTTVPIIVLINNYTASAAEILAGALKIYSEKYAQEAKKAGKEQTRLMVFLLGTKTFGKGSVQDVIPLSNNCALKLTTALYYLPNDTSIQGIGIEPDFYVERHFGPPEQITWLTQYFGREETMDNHIKQSNKEKLIVEKMNGSRKDSAKKDEKPKTMAEQARKQLEEDNQFRDAIMFINLLDTAKTKCPVAFANREDAINFLKCNCTMSEKLILEEIKG